MTANEKLNLVCERIGVVAEDRPQVIETNTRFLIGDALEVAANTGLPVAWIESHREFPGWDEMVRVLSEQAADTTASNPLPGFLIDLTDEVPTIDAIIYNGVSGMDVAGYPEEITHPRFDGNPLSVRQFLDEIV